MGTDGFIFYEVTSLQEMAAHSVALNAWLRCVSSRSMRYICKPKAVEYIDQFVFTYQLKKNHRDEYCDYISSLELTEPLQNRVKTASDDILHQVEKWINHFYGIVFCDESSRFQYCLRGIDGNCFVWSQNCKIDYVKTASKILSEAKLTEVNKFIIMCKFPVEDEITRFSQNSSDWKTGKIPRDPPLKYWICRLKNETFTPPDDSGKEDEFADLYNNVDFAMSVVCGYPDEFGFDYFWGRFCANYNDIETAARMILPRARESHHMSIMSKLSTSQQRRLLCEFPDVIIRNFVSLNMLESAKYSWKQTAHLMTEDQFHKLVVWLFYESNDFYTPYYDGFSEKYHAFLVYVWDTAPDRLKTHLLQVTTDSVPAIVKSFFHGSHQHSGSGLKFFHRFLSLKTAEYRKSLMLEMAIPFATKVPVFEPRLTTDLLNLCLPCDDDRLAFKKSIMASKAMKTHLKSLYHSGKIRDLNVKLEIFSSHDIVAIRKLKKWLLMQSRSVAIRLDNFVINLDRWKELSEFIDEAFADDTSLAFISKKNFILGFCKFPPFFTYFNYEKIVEVVEYVLPLEDVKTFKKNALDSLRFLIDIEYDAVFEKEKLSKCLRWCLGDKKKVKKLISTVPANMIE